VTDLPPGTVSLPGPGPGGGPVAWSATPAAAAPPGSGPRPAPVPSPRGRAPRRARLTVRRFDPWSVLKVAFVYSISVWLVCLVAVAVLYAALDAMGVFRALRRFFHDLGTATPMHYLAFEPVFLTVVVVGAVMAVLSTALLTLAAFLYNLCGELVGGVEVTFTEPD
jgi:hypothetical protein